MLRRVFTSTNRVRSGQPPILKMKVAAWRFASRCSGYFPFEFLIRRVPCFLFIWLRALQMAWVLAVLTSSKASFS